MKRTTFLSIIFMLVTTIASAQWTQMGADIDGEVAGDASGCAVSVSSDGNTVAIGANYNDGNGTDAGHVRIYHYNGMAWSQVGADIDGEAAGDYSGQSLSVSSDGNTVAIGAPGNDGNGSYAGHVRIYHYNGTSWTQMGADIDGETSLDYSGSSVSVSSDGNTVAIGAYGNDGNGSGAGHVRIYHYNGTAWSQMGADIDGEAAGDYSGWSVSLSSNGNTVAIGAPGNDENGTNSGHVRIYHYNGTSWTQVGADINGEAAGDQSGSSVSVSSDGNTVAIGANRNDGNGADAGHVQIYNYNGTAWSQVGADIDGEATGDQSGNSVSVSSDGNTVAIGAAYNDGNGTNAGHVRIYHYNGTAWAQVGADIDGEAVEDYSGSSVSLSSDGNTVAIGAPLNDGNGTNAGLVRIYTCNTFETIVETTCDTYTSPSGNYAWTSSGNYIDSIPNAFGADSIITIDLTIIYSTTAIDVQTACFSYLWIDGNTYTSSNNTATHTLTNAAGCDSIVTLDLTINTVDATVTTTGITLTANESGANYQWVMCPSLLHIGGGTNQSYTPTINGWYAVIVDNGLCIDTSACYDISGVGINENGIASAIAIYPNPTTGKITIECEKMQRVEVLDITGKQVYALDLSSDMLDIDISDFSKGIYFVRVRTENGVAVQRIVLE
jgi:hypothetical protein